MNSDKLLNTLTAVCNRLPDPAILFLWLLVIVMVVSFGLSFIEFSAIHPVTNKPIEIANLLSGESLTDFATNMVKNFVTFAPLGAVLVSLLGIGVAEHSGFINLMLKKCVNAVPARFLTPCLVLIGLMSSVTPDAGYLLVIPIGGMLYYAAGRHPLAGIFVAYAAVSGGYAANFLPSAIDPILQGSTMSAIKVVDPDHQVNVLNNWFFTASSGIPLTLILWFMNDRLIEPYLGRKLPVDANVEEESADKLLATTTTEDKAYKRALLSILALIGLTVLVAYPESSPLRSATTGQLADYTAPFMHVTIPMIFIFFLVPGLVYGFSSGAFKRSTDVIEAMTQAMKDCGPYIVLIFFCAQFGSAFANSNLGALIAVEGSAALEAINLPGGVTIVGLIALIALINIIMGSASAKWAIIAPVFIPILMQLGISPDLGMAAYRVADSSTNIISPVMPYLPLIILAMQKYVKSSGIGTLLSMMVPYSVVLLIVWTAWLLAYWAMGLPLGLQSSYTYMP